MARTSSQKIAYFKQAPFFVITLNSPETLNALSYDDYIYITTLLELSENDPECFFTVLQSSGRFFSSGADFNSIPPNEASAAPAPGAGRDPDKVQMWLENFLCKNQYITQSFIRHSKILIACLNGPAIGLSAAIVLICDLVYAMDIDKTYLQFPFSKLGLSNEGAVSWTLPRKFGRNRSFERLLFAKRIDGREIEGTVINSSKVSSTDLMKGAGKNTGDVVQEYNRLILEELTAKCANVYLPTVLKMKQLLRDESATSQMELLNSKEVNGALPFWIDGIPQGRFQALKAAKAAKKASTTKF
ncbi:hypothetical protein DAKH74_018850 [Maudiozyma humilis]|uniref:Uncharacterized protein n=1 Tax=Maudiozyma humilis TaxID=51915 RepID=A0AAV5RUP3_MAUHU|nr:hypothetical protein DAKH74_018850 [Kazachstania humilis]